METIKDKKLPGNTLLPSTKKELNALLELENNNSKYSVEDFFKKPDKSEFQLSPNGNFLSYMQRDENGKNHLYLLDIITNKSTLVLKQKEEIIRNYFWINKNRIAFIKDKGGNENYHLFAIDIDGQNEKDLTPYENTTLQILSLLKEQDDYIIIALNKENIQIFEPYKININTGELEKLYENKDVSNPIMDYNFDKDGNLKAFAKKENGTDIITYFKTKNSSEFKVVTKASWQDSFSIVGFDYKNNNTDTAYVISNLNNDTTELILQDFNNNKTVKKIYSNNIFDINDVSFGTKKRNYELDYITFRGEKNTIIPFSDFFKKIYAKFEEKFKGKNIYIINKTKNEDKFLLYINSDKINGIYYLYDTTKNTFKELINVLPHLKEDDMAEMRPIKFKSRDGLDIYGYLTIPNIVNKGEKVSLIVNPHGGPYGVRDFWRFNSETQVFASRNFATLQVNYRGSGGYGKKFFLAGSKQIGRKMLDDLEDGVEYVKSLGFIKEDKIAIYGGSYGGLATLGSLVKTPDLYCCGIDYVGVSNLFTFMNTMPPYWEPYRKIMYQQWYDPTNEEEKEIMKECSPALNTEKITKPLFVIQGANDPRVNIDESDQIVSNLRGRNVDVPYLVKYNEGHGFHHEENVIELYKYMIGFFEKYLN